MANISGTITRVFPLQTGTTQQGAEWRKQSFIVREDDPRIAYPDELLFDLFNDRIPAEGLAVGQHVDIHFGVRVREFNGRFFNDHFVVKLA